MTNHKSIGTPSFDSLKLSFDITQVDVLNADLLDTKVRAEINKDTGDITYLDDIKVNSLKYQYEEYQIHFAIGKHMGEERAVILINTKLLESNYRDGMSMRNIELVYNKIMGAKVFYIDFLDFLEYGLWSDVDIKKDLMVESDKEFAVITKELDNATTPSRKSNVGSNRFNKPTNKGIQFNSRTNSTYTNPYLKVYHKGIESMFGKNAEFFNKYLQPETFKNVLRVEATIKNQSTQGVKYGIKSNKLIDLLKMSEEQMNNVLNYCLKANTEERIAETKIVVKADYSPYDLMLYAVLKERVESGMDVDYYINYLTASLSPKERSRKKKLLKRIYKAEIKHTPLAQISERANNVLNELGWGKL